jgi:hypothetical protein
MDVRFTNESDETLTLAHNMNSHCVLVKVEPAHCHTLEPEESVLLRVKKASGILEGAYGPEVLCIWRSDDDGAWISYVVQNPINGHPEGAFECYLTEDDDWGPIWGKLMAKKRDTNFFESNNRRLSADYTRTGEDAIIWTITYK